GAVERGGKLLRVHGLRRREKHRLDGGDQFRRGRDRTRGIAHGSSTVGAFPPASSLGTGAPGASLRSATRISPSRARWKSTMIWSLTISRTARNEAMRSVRLG